MAGQRDQRERVRGGAFVRQRCDVQPGRRRPARTSTGNVTFVDTHAGRLDELRLPGACGECDRCLQLVEHLGDRLDRSAGSGAHDQVRRGHSPGSKRAGDGLLERRPGETGYRVEWSATSDFATIAGSGTTAADVLTVPDRQYRPPGVVLPRGRGQCDRHLMVRAHIGARGVVISDTDHHRAPTKSRVLVVVRKSTTGLARRSSQVRVWSRPFDPARVVLVRPVPRKRVQRRELHPCERSWTSSRLGNRVAAIHRRASSICSCESSTANGRMPVVLSMMVLMMVSFR